MNHFKLFKDYEKSKRHHLNEAKDEILEEIILDFSNRTKEQIENANLEFTKVIKF